MDTQIEKIEQQTVGKITIDKQAVIGKGSDGGVVYKGVYENEPVAVKRICLTHAKDVAILLNPSVCHDNLLRYFGQEGSDDFLYLIMELCADSLESLIDGSYHGPPIGSKREVMRQTGLGLQYLHSRNIVHGSVNPQNILISQPNGTKLPKIKLADFGIGKEPGRRLSETIDAMGWRAPEFYIGEVPCPTYACDIFSFGCVLGYYWTNGQHPFGDGTSRAGNIKRHQMDWKAESDVPEDLRRLIKRMTDHLQEKRPSIDEVMANPVLGPTQFNPDCLAENKKPTVTYTLEKGVLSIVEHRKIKVYDRDFMLSLQYTPASRAWPKLLKDLSCVRLKDIELEDLATVCNAILDAAITNSQFSPDYADRCCELWSKTVPNNTAEKRKFSEVFLEYFESKFENECFIIGETAKGGSGVAQHNETSNSMDHTRLFGLVRLLEEMFKLGLVAEKVIRSHIIRLLSQFGVETSLKCACCVLLSDIEGNKKASGRGFKSLDTIGERGETKQCNF